MNTEIALERIREHLGGITELSNRLLLVVGRTGDGKTAAIRALGNSEGVPVVRVGVGISRRLMLLAPMRPDKEAARMKWKHVHFGDRYLIVAESKTAAGEGRLISMNDELTALLTAHAEPPHLAVRHFGPGALSFPEAKTCAGRPNATR